MHDIEALIQRHGLAQVLTWVAQHCKDHTARLTWFTIVNNIAAVWHEEITQEWAKADTKDTTRN